MLEVVQFDNGKYGLRNVWTGVILTKRGKARMFRTPYTAKRKAEKLDRNLMKTVNNITRKG